MKHTKLLVVALLVALLACLAVTAMADDPCLHPKATLQLVEQIVKPTCTTDGVGKYQCLVCGEYVNAAIPHTGIHSFETKSVEPTCGSDGYTRRSCIWCGYVDAYQTVPATGAHNWVKYADAVAPTCTTPGTKEWKICSVCKTLKTPQPEVDPALGHIVEGVEYEPIQEANCAQDGIIAKYCTRCGKWVDAKNVGRGKHDAGWYTYDKTHAAGSGYVLGYKAPDCTSTGCTAVYQCSICGEQKGGEVVSALGHKMYDDTGKVMPWIVKTKASCATEGVLGRKCDRCKQWVETQNVGKTAYHSDVNGTANGFESCYTKVDWDNGPTVTASNPAFVLLDAKKPSCTADGCGYVFQCPTCGATKGGEVLKARGHHIDAYSWKDGKEPTCTAAGVRLGHCTVCGKDDAYKETIPAYGHSAVWQIAKTATATETGLAELKCYRCDQVIGMKILMPGDPLPSGQVNTGAAASTAAANTAKASSTKTTTAKSSSTKSASTSASTKTAAAPATTETKKVATVAAVVAAPAALAENQAQLVADKHLYVVKNVAGEEIVLTVNVADGKITVEANLAEGESLVLYANAEAIDAPTAENTLVLTANEAVELPEAFANAILAVVKTESLPAAVAAK